MDRVTRAKIDSLLYEIRSWDAGEHRSSADELAARFRLDPLLVRRIAEDEGIRLDGEEPREDVDPNQATALMSMDELEL